MNTKKNELPRILIVDDEMDMRIFLSTVFETGGYQVFTARDGREALSRARKDHPDLILLDLMMPGEGGIHMYRRLKEEADLADIPVIVLSGVAKGTFFHYLRMMNVQPEESVPEPSAYLEKPPEPDLLLQTVDAILSSHASPENAPMPDSL